MITEVQKFYEKNPINVTAADAAFNKNKKKTKQNKTSTRIAVPLQCKEMLTFVPEEYCLVMPRYFLTKS